MVLVKVLKLQDFCSTPQFIKSVVNSIENLLAQTESRDLELLNEKNIYCPTYFLALLEDDDIENNARVNGNSYKKSGTLFISQTICT